jgi:hypothetical protein
MNSTEKAAMQVDELEDGGAAVLLPEGEENPQAAEQETEKPSTNSAQSRDEDDDDEQVAQEEEVDEDREAIRAARREERKLKKQIHREKAKESNYLINALKKQNQELSERLAAVERTTSGAELARVDKAIEDAGVQVEYAKMKMKDAVSNGDGESLTRAQEMWYESKRKLESLETIKKNATKQITEPKQNITGPDPVVQRMASEWMAANPWYDPNGRNEESQIAKLLDQRLHEEGFDASSPEYWEELDSRIQKYLPAKSSSGYNQSNVQQRRPPRSVMTSSGKETTATTKANEFRLSPARVAAMKEAGLWDNPTARQNAIQKYAEWDRQQKNRG